MLIFLGLKSQLRHLKKAVPQLHICNFLKNVAPQLHIRSRIFFISPQVFKDMQLHNFQKFTTSSRNLRLTLSQFVQHGTAQLQFRYCNISVTEVESILII